MATNIDAEWWSVTLHSPQAEELAFELMDLGAGGCEQLEPDLLRCFFNGNISQCKKLIESAQQLGFVLQNCEAVVNQNWVAKCSELWQPITAGKLSIIPIAGSSESHASEDNTIALIPGSGFGTGHHESTRLMLELMQDVRIAESNPRSVLDLGTGSGILAIAASKLFPTLSPGSIFAIDNDPQALINANDNILINRCQDVIHLAVGTLPLEARKENKSFDLVVANIYAEVLCKLESEIRTVTAIGGHLVMSGIMTVLAPSVVATFESFNWQLLRRETLARDEVLDPENAMKGSWTGLLYRRIA